MHCRKSGERLSYAAERHPELPGSPPASTKSLLFPPATHIPSLSTDSVLGALRLFSLAGFVWVPGFVSPFSVSVTLIPVSSDLSLSQTSVPCFFLLTES